MQIIFQAHSDDNNYEILRRNIPSRDVICFENLIYAQLSSAEVSFSFLRKISINLILELLL